MQIRAGFEIAYDCPQPTPMLLVLSVHPSRMPDLIGPHRITFDPPIGATDYRDGFGNICTRILAPAGRTDHVRRLPGPGPRHARRRSCRRPTQHPVQDLPDEALVYLLGSRYCETDRLTDTAWSLFGGTPPGWARVQAICDYVHDRITFGYEHADPTRTALGRPYRAPRRLPRLRPSRGHVLPLHEHPGALLHRLSRRHRRAAVDAPMDFSAWFEVYLGGHWHTFDARHNTPRIGRILMARGRDATDVAIATTFGPCTLAGFKVVTDEVPPPAPRPGRPADDRINMVPDLPGGPAAFEPGRRRPGRPLG